MEQHHINKVQERCRVCCRLLVAPRDKKSRRSFQCTEFAADLHSVFDIETHNDPYKKVARLAKSYQENKK